MFRSMVALVVVLGALFVLGACGSGVGSDGVIVIDGANVSTTDAPADCTISLSKSDLEDLLAGELSPTAAFMQGKMKIDGDMSVAMALSQLM